METIAGSPAWAATPTGEDIGEVASVDNTVAVEVGVARRCSAGSPVTEQLGDVARVDVGITVGVARAEWRALAVELVAAEVGLGPVDVHAVAAEERAEHAQTARLHPHPAHSRRRVVAHLAVL